MKSVSVREAMKEDLEQASELIVRMKKLNGEFDPLFKVAADVGKKASQYLLGSIGSDGKLVIVAVDGKRVVGVLRAEIRERPFYLPSKEGRITDFYILPEERRRALGQEMLEQVSNRLKQMGTEMITAEFPARNEIAARFYMKRGFRAIFNIFAKERSDQ